MNLLKNKKFNELNQNLLSEIEGGRNQIAYQLGYGTGKAVELFIQLLPYIK